MFYGAGGLGTGHTALALDGGGKRRAFAADECACAAVDADGEIEIGAEDMLAEKACFLSLCDSVAEPCDGKGVFCTNVDVAVFCAGGNTCDHHAFEHTMGVALHDGAVHECAGVTLVAVAYDVLGQFLLTAYLAPLLAGGESSAAPAPKVGLGNLVDDLVAGHIEQRLFKCDVTAVGDVLLDGGGVHLAGKLTNDHLLLLEEGDVVTACIGLAVLGKQQPFDYLALEDGLFDYLFTVADLNLGIQPALGLDPDEGTALADAVAGALLESDLFLADVFGVFGDLHGYGNVPLLHYPLQLFEHVERADGNAAGLTANEDAASFCCHCVLISKTREVELLTIIELKH